MPKYNFYLRDKNAKNATPVILYIRYDNYLLKYGTGETIEPKFWNENDQKASKSMKTYAEFNTLLRNLENTAENIFRTFLNDNNQNTPSIEVLKDLLNEKLNRKVKPMEKPIDLIGFCDKFLEESRSRTNPQTGKPINKDTLKVYNQAINELKNYKDLYFKQKDFSFGDIDYTFYVDYQLFLINIKGYSTNTVGKHTKTLKTFFLEANARGLMPDFNPRKFKVVSEEVDSIYLTTDDLKLLQNLDLKKNKKLDEARDMFLVGCTTGLRFSDFTRIKPHHIDGDYINIQTKKTLNWVVIPIMPILRQILNKYSNKLPRAFSNQKMNEYLKEIGEMANLKDSFTKTSTKAGKKTVQTYQKYELLTTHTARRSFASNAYLMGVPTIHIMKITGHLTESAFMKYIKIMPKESAEKMREIMLGNEKNTTIEIAL